MNDFSELKSIYFAALEHPSPAERSKYLHRACGDNEPLRRQVEKMLAAYLDAESFLESPAVELHAAAGLHVTADQPSRERPGIIIAGRYKLLEQIGEGGMGTVWVAEQTEPVKRRVALKVIKPGMDSRQVLSRFEAERQALALMDYPNIAKVFDGGMTDEGRPYFVMEYVKGMPITEYCDNSRLSIQDRLKLFVPVCQAVQHAHQKGIIHRDLKPSNILVCLYDGQPVPKVIDFGLAKAMHQPLTEHTLYTAQGLMVGTPLYMSPEQAEFNNLDVDTRSDIYSLGVILYELLTGTTPLQKQQFKDAAFQEILRLIKEVEPQRPSLKISTSISLPALAAQRSLEPAQLSRTVRGDLDWIVMKALEKERSRRYETANGLARDVERYLSDAPVEACPPSARYRLKKALRRNKGPALAAAIVLLTLLGGIVGTTWGLIRAEKSRQVAENSRQAESQQRLLAEAARERETARAEAEARERRRAETAEAAALVNERQAATERDHAEQEKRIAQAVKDFLQNRLLNQADARNQADALLEAGDRLAETKENPTIRELLDRAAAELTPAKIETQFPNLPLVQAEILRTIGDTYNGVGEYGPASEHLERSRDLYVAQLGPDHPVTLGTLHDLALVYRRTLDYSKAIQLFEQVRDQQIATLGPGHPATLATLNSLGYAYVIMGKELEAIQLYEQVRDQRLARLGPDHPDTLSAMQGLAGAYRSAMRLPDAIQLWEQVRDGRLARLGPDHPETLSTLNSLATAYRDAGKFIEAIRLYEQVRDRQIAKLGPDHPDTLSTLSGMAWAYQFADKLPEALRIHEELVSRARRVFGPDHSTTRGMMSNWRLALYRAGQFGKAAEVSRELLTVARKRSPPDTRQLTVALAFLGESLLKAGQFADAEAVLKECAQIHEQARSDSPKFKFMHKSLLGEALLGQQKYAEAEPLLLAGYEGLKQREAKLASSVRSGKLVDALERLVQFYDQWDKPDEADKWRKTLDDYRASTEVVANPFATR